MLQVQVTSGCREDLEEEEGQEEGQGGLEE